MNDYRFKVKGVSENRSPMQFKIYVRRYFLFIGFWRYCGDVSSIDKARELMHLVNKRGDV